MRGVNSGAIDNERNAASASFKANPPGTAHLGALQRCAGTPSPLAKTASLCVATRLALHPKWTRSHSRLLMK
ncbi:hypothetical protein GCM10011396_09090 [Undibacterium terreum]|uniref:Uncharacterized protein n=1 Tax=Undibacterium terreum TaxID=1224302 RepID=A0A916U8A2_9BURK|nr:hypothetical protein GCM10011396_09090 [Undibacterium terreum]